MFSRFPVRYLIPNTITAATIVLACVAIVLGHDGLHELAAWLIVWCVLLDRTDGFAARLSNAYSEFGGQLDSLADFLAFCVAPGLLVYFLLADDLRYRRLFDRPVYKEILIVSTLVYVVSGAARLARFNVTSAQVGPDRFEGLSSTFAGFIVATFLLSGERHSWPPDVMATLLLVLALCAVFMISNLSLPKSLTSHQRRLFPLLVLVHVLAFGLGILRLFPEVLLILALAYPILGFTIGARLNRGMKTAVARAESRSQ
jgi:CDP-diacylglycerol--serine O-phosphatidyltransferase